jgi:hypothetical protein
METGQAYGYAGDDPVDNVDPSGLLPSAAGLDSKSAALGSAYLLIEARQDEAQASQDEAELACEVQIEGKQLNQDWLAEQNVYAPISTAQKYHSDLESAMETLGPIVRNLGQVALAGYNTVSARGDLQDAFVVEQEAQNTLNSAASVEEEFESLEDLGVATGVVEASAAAYGFTISDLFEAILEALLL